MNAIKLVRPSTDSEKQTKTVVDTIMVTPEICDSWMVPPFQRPIKENERVRTLAEELKRDGGVWPGIVTLGVLARQTYIVDGQHRRHAFVLSGVPEGYVDVRIHYFSTMAEMGEEFVRLNSQLVKLRPDDILRGLEASAPALQALRAACPFVGYDMVRRGSHSPVVSMNMILRQWRGSAGDVPSPNTGGVSVAQLGTSIEDQELVWLLDFLKLAYASWGRDPEYTRLWGALNIILCMWLYRRLVLTQYSPRTPRLTKEQFRKCLMSLSAETEYLDWLVGRGGGERDRSPAYDRIKRIFAARLHSETGEKFGLPQPSWAAHSGSRGR